MRPCNNGPRRTSRGKGRRGAYGLWVPLYTPGHAKACRGLLSAGSLPMGRYADRHMQATKPSHVGAPGQVCSA